MAVRAVDMLVERGLLLQHAPALILVVVVLAILMPRPACVETATARA